MNLSSNITSLLFICCLLGMLACNSSTNSNKAAVATTANQKATSSAPTSKTKPATVNAKKQLSTQGVQVKMNPTSAKSGTETCVDMEVNNFNDVVSMQYSINWDPKLLTYKEMRNFKLKDLSKANFGAQKAKEGKLTFSWYDQAIKGISVPDKTIIHQVCFDAIGKKGSKAKLMITQDPIIVEITGKGGTFLKFSSDPAYIKIK